MLKIEQNWAKIANYPLNAQQGFAPLHGVSNAGSFSTADTYQASTIALSSLLLPVLFTLHERVSASTAMLNAGKSIKLLNVAKTTL